MHQYQRFFHAAWRRNLQLPRPILLLLIVELALVAPIPVLLLRPQPPAIQSPTAAGVALAPLAPLVPLLTPAARRQQLEQAPDLPLLVAAERLQDSTNVDTNTIADYLARQPSLARLTFDVGQGVQQPLAAVITGQALRWNINPLVLLSMLEVQSRLLSAPDPAHFDQALGGPPERQGLDQQLAWAATELHHGLLAEQQAALPLVDGTLWPLAAPLDPASYSLLRLLAATHTAPALHTLLSDGDGSWLSLTAPLLGDPRRAYRLQVLDQPLLSMPFTATVRPLAQFDHHYPMVLRDGQMDGGDPALELGYDGHNGWDYALPLDQPILAAADGAVVFAGWIDSGCATPAGVVVVQHGAGYRTSYWHLQRIDVVAGTRVTTGTPLGRNGATGCAESPHLHFSVQRLGRDVDPAGWCRAERDPWAAHPAGAPSYWLWLDHPSSCPFPQGALFADDSDSVAALLEGPWHTSSTGNYGTAHWAQLPSTAQIIWRPALATAGWYQLYVFVPNQARSAGPARYVIDHADGRSSVTIDQGAQAGSWISLGHYRFLAGQRAIITLAGAEQPGAGTVWADALALVAEPGAATTSKAGLPDK